MLLAVIVDLDGRTVLVIVGKLVDGVVTSWNPAAERMFGYSRDDDRGSRPRFSHLPTLSMRSSSCMRT